MKFRFSLPWFPRRPNSEARSGDLLLWATALAIPHLLHSEQGSSKLQFAESILQKLNDDNR